MSADLVLGAAAAAQLGALALAWRGGKGAAWRIMALVPAAMMAATAMAIYRQAAALETALAVFLVSSLLAIAFGLMRRSGVSPIRPADGGSATEARFREATEAVDQVVWESDVDGRYVYLSDNIEQVFGIDPGEFIGKHFTKFIVPEQIQAVIDQTRAIGERMASFRDIEFQIEGTDGRPFWISAAGTPLLAPDGSLTGYRGISRRIDQRKRIEIALRESEARLAAAQRIARLGNWDWDLASDRVEWSDEVYRIFGWVREETEATAKTFRSAVHPDDRDLVVRSYTAYIEDGTPYSLDHRIVRSDGEVRIVHEEGELLRDGDGRPKRMRGTIQDVTERTRAEQALRESEARFRNLVEGSIQGILVADRDLNLLFANQAVATVFGYDSAAHMLEAGAHDRDIAPHEIERLRAYSKARLDGAGAPGAYEFEAVRRDGDAIWLENMVTVVEWDGVPALLSTIVDITARKRAEAALKESEERLIDAIDSISEGFALFDADDRLVLCNERYRELAMPAKENIRLGVTFEELCRRYAATGQIVAAREDAEAWVRQRVERHRDPSGSFETERSDGWLQVRENRTSDGGTVSVLTDITELKHREQELRQAQKMEAVGQLTGGIAHDFNNLLAVAMGNLELLEEKLEDHPEARDLALRALAATERGATLTHRLLAFSRKQALRPQRTDFNALVTEMSALLRSTLGETIAIELDLTQDLSDIFVDRSQLENTLWNLAVNARDAMPEGGVLTIETANFENEGNDGDALAPGRYAVLTVRDTGEGMAPEVAERAIEPFFTTKDPTKGSGLGLSMIYGFVKQSSGHVEISSEPGAGTAVRIYLPEARPDQIDVFDRAADSDEQRGHGQTILVVEDDAAVRQLAVSLMTILGYATVEAADGASALEMLEKKPEIELLFTDVVLPGGMSGTDLAAEAARRRPEIKVLFTSGYTKDAFVNAGRLDQRVDLIEKPYRRASLASRLGAVLG